jgi:hypothetical protein
MRRGNHNTITMRSRRKNAAEIAEQTREELENGKEI